MAKLCFPFLDRVSVSDVRGNASQRRIFPWGFFHGVDWNPLVFLALCGIAVFDVYAAIVLVIRAPRLRFDLSRFDGRMIRLAAMCLLAFSWIYSLGHWRDF